LDDKALHTDVQELRAFIPGVAQGWSDYARRVMVCVEEWDDGGLYVGVETAQTVSL
jgi:hypothetical protein